MAFWPPYWGCRDDSKCNRFLPTQWNTKFAVLLRNAVLSTKPQSVTNDQKCKRNIIQIDLSTFKPTLLKMSTYSFFSSDCNFLVKCENKNLSCKVHLVSVCIWQNSLHIWPIVQTYPNHNLTLTLKLTLTLTLALTLTLGPNLNPNPIASALRDWPNIAQFVKFCTHLHTNTAAFGQTRNWPNARSAIPSEAIHSRKL